MFDFFLNKKVDANGCQDGKCHPKHSSKGRPFTEWRIFPEQEHIKHEPKHRSKGKDNQKKKKVKDTFDDKFKLGEFHSVFSEYVYECLNKYNFQPEALFERLD